MSGQTNAPHYSSTGPISAVFRCAVNPSPHLCDTVAAIHPYDRIRAKLYFVFSDDATAGHPIIIAFVISLFYDRGPTAGGPFACALR